MAELIEALGQLRAQVIQIGHGGRSVSQDDELRGQFMIARIAFLRLSGARSDRIYADNHVAGIDSLVDFLDEKIRAQERENVLGLALDAVRQDYAPEKIDAAIGIAESQQP